MTLDRDEEWYKDFESFHNLVAKLTSYDSPLSPEDKVSKLIRMLRTRISPIAMVAESSVVPFEKVIASVKVKISHRKTQGTSKHIPPMAASASQIQKNQGRDSSRISKSKKNACFVCGKPGHFANKCWYRSDGSRGLGRG